LDKKNIVLLKKVVLRLLDLPTFILYHAGDFFSHSEYARNLHYQAPLYVLLPWYDDEILLYDLFGIALWTGKFNIDALEKPAF
jgi:hypothetical protein